MFSAKFSRSALHLATVLTLLAVFAACSSDVRQLVITARNQQQVETDVINDASLSTTEKTEFRAALYRWGYQPNGNTVQQIIRDERAYDAKQQVANDRMFRQILGSWACLGSAFADGEHPVFTFAPNHIETISTTSPKGQYSMPFDLTSYTLHEKGDPEFLDTITLTGGILRITRIAQRDNEGEMAALPSHSIYTCRRSREPRSAP